MLGILVSLPFLFAQGPAPAQGGAAAAPSAPAAAPVAPASAPVAPGAPAAAPVAGTAPAAGAPAAQPSPFSTLLPLLPIPILFYFLMIRPQQQQERKRKGMINAMQRNDKVVTAGGLYGTIVGFNTEDDTVTLRIDDDRGVKVVFSKSSIVRVIDSIAEKEKEKKGETAKEV